MRELNGREEAFARAVALEGMGPSAAYRQAYGSKMAPDAVASNAKRLLRRSQVKQRIAELREQGPGGAFGLTPKQDDFCRFYLEKSNASEAYRLAYQVAPDTKSETINRSAAELLANPKITARLAGLRAELRKRHDITMDDLVEVLRPVVFSDIRKVVCWGDAVAIKDPETGEVSIAQGVAIKNSAEIEDAAALSIAEIHQSKDGAMRVKLHDKLSAVEKLGKLLGLIKEQHEHAGKGGGPIQHEVVEPKKPNDDILKGWAEKYRIGREKHAARQAQPEERAKTAPQ